MVDLLEVEEVELQLEVVQELQMQVLVEEEVQQIQFQVHQ
jgi:hypothetical protein